MITSQRVIIYRTEMNNEETDYEVLTEYDFSSIASVVIIGLFLSLIHF